MADCRLKEKHGNLAEDIRTSAGATLGETSSQALRVGAIITPLVPLLILYSCVIQIVAGLIFA